MPAQDVDSGRTASKTPDDLEISLQTTDKGTRALAAPVEDQVVEIEMSEV